MTSNQIAAKQAETAADQARTAQRDAATRQRDAETKRRAQESRSKLDDAQRKATFWQTLFKGIDTLGRTAKNVGDTAKSFGAVKSIVGAANDPAWYNKDKQLVRDAASIPFATPVGTPIALDDYLITDGEQAYHRKLSAPLLLAMGFIPSIGMTEADEQATPINVAARNIYAFVRYANSGARNYEACDMLLYMLAMDSLYTGASFLAKCYGVALKANPSNRTFPKHFLESVGIDTDDLLSNLANYRGRLNALIQKIAQFNVPANFPVYARHSWLATNVFTDYNVTRSSMYTFYPTFLYKYSEGATTISGAGNLLAVPFATPHIGKKKMTELLQVLEAMVQVLLESEDIGIMSGDIAKAYGDKVYVISQVPETYEVPVTYSEEVLTQIHAADLLPTDVNAATLNINQTITGMLTYGDAVGTDKRFGPQFYLYADSTLLFPLAGDRYGQMLPDKTRIILNTYNDNPTPDEIMVMTRLSTAWRVTNEFTQAPDTPTRQVIEVTSCGSEMLNGAILCFMDDEGIIRYKPWDGFGYQWGSLYASLLGTSDPNAAIQYRDLTKLVQQYSSFDWAPNTAFYTAKPYFIDSNKNARLTLLPWLEMYDIVNYAVIDKSALDVLHTVALQSEFAVPDFGNTPRNQQRNSRA